jgi:hypothetical protein
MRSDFETKTRNPRRRNSLYGAAKSRSDRSRRIFANKES